VPAPVCLTSITSHGILKEVFRSGASCEGIWKDHWLPWLRDEFGWSDRTARKYMAVAEAFKSEPGSVLADINIDSSALYLLSGNGVYCFGGPISVGQPMCPTVRGTGVRSAAKSFPQSLQCHCAEIRTVKFDWHLGQITFGSSFIGISLTSGREYAKMSEKPHSEKTTSRDLDLVPAYT
jgi:hypothetical protein